VLEIDFSITRVHNICLSKLLFDVFTVKISPEFN